MISKIKRINFFISNRLIGITETPMKVLFDLITYTPLTSKKETTSLVDTKSRYYLIIVLSIPESRLRMTLESLFLSVLSPSFNQMHPVLDEGFPHCLLIPV